MNIAEQESQQLREAPRARASGENLISKVDGQLANRLRLLSSQMSHRQREKRDLRVSSLDPRDRASAQSIDRGSFGRSQRSEYGIEDENNSDLLGSEGEFEHEMMRSMGDY